MRNWVIEPMTLEHYRAAYLLWQTTPGVGLGKADSREGVARFLRHNPGLSFVALVDDEVVGTILCGHDGRRGYIYHLAVTSFHRRRGIGRVLVEQVLAALKQTGIDKCHLFVFARNHPAQAFWQTIGGIVRAELAVFSFHPP